MIPYHYLHAGCAVEACLNPATMKQYNHFLSKVLMGAEASIFISWAQQRANRACPRTWRTLVAPINPAKQVCPGLTAISQDRKSLFRDLRRGITSLGLRCQLSLGYDVSVHCASQLGPKVGYRWVLQGRWTHCGLY